jgi:hypothetical protein
MCATAVFVQDVPPPGDLVTPGIVGFAVILLLGAVTLFLVFDMMRRVRRANYRIDVKEKLDEEERRKKGESGQVHRENESKGERK